ncbi:MFS general substrate transporter [Aaosphaeria arxii CBS 175.79]|uniref:MFS general substrate transporter n=1 Tax=Aaosphaeria arxii CBS 175.79 TaxID=1450172 RepID=A0A6A5XCL6_9PLEO|nr:MFS general substrate transporter [Aaosphaeria arxii CBS 175.79]KAF2010556.1 MFS general substrate transporter [Aaosphaeria arxii CBS 175.79]
MGERLLVRYYRDSKTSSVQAIGGLSVPDLDSRCSSESSRTFVSSASPLTEAVSDGWPPQDEGRAAWVFLFGASIIEAVSWGFPACFGVFREYYFTHPPFKGVKVLAVTGVLSDGCLQMLMPLLLLFLKRHPQFNRRMMWTGLLFCVVACIGASFSTKAWQIIATQGAIYGMGAGFLSAPIIVLMSEWFDKRQSFAYGIMFGSSGLCGSFMPTVYSKLLHASGQRFTLLVYGSGVLVLTTGALLCVGHRIPLNERGTLHEAEKMHPPSSSNYDFWTKASFWLLGGSVIVQACVLNLPAIYLPSFVTDLQYSPAQGAIALSMFNLSTASGQVGFGLFADHRSSFYSTLIMSTIVSGLSSLLYWGEVKSLSASVIFATMYGASSGGFGILRSRFAGTVVGDSGDREQILIVLGLFTAARGAGNVAGGFIGQGLVDEDISVQWRSYGLQKWMPLILFVTAGMLLAGALGGLQQVHQRLGARWKNRNPQWKRSWPRSIEDLKSKL